MIENYGTAEGCPTLQERNLFNNRIFWVSQRFNFNLHEIV